MSGVLRAVYPPNYYIIPEHHIRLSDDRTELMFEQHLPGVRREELNVEVLEKSICLNFQPVGKDPISRCYSLPYRVVPTTAEGAPRRPFGDQSEAGGRLGLGEAAGAAVTRTGTSSG